MYRWEESRKRARETYEERKQKKGISRISLVAYIPEQHEEKFKKEFWEFRQKFLDENK